MYSTEYDLLVAADRFRELQAEMREINTASAIRARSTARPTLLDRLIGLVGRGAQTPMPHRKVGAAA
jgi:hypothetical protein